jgi:amino acid adenylation domain-containing protein
VHHAVFDGWSKALLFKELALAYAALLQQQTLALPELPYQFADVARRQQQAHTQRDLDFWRSYLRDIPALQHLPLDFPRPSQPSDEALLLPIDINAEISAGLQAVARAHGCTLFMVLLALFQLLLYRFGGEADQVTGTPVDTRQGDAERQLIGFFLNTLCIRTPINPEWRWSELLAAVKQSVLAAFQHQRLPFEQVVEAINPERSQSYTPLFQSMFVLQHATAGAPNLSGLTTRKLSLGNGSTKYDVYFTLLASDTGLKGWLNVRRDLFRCETVQALADGFQELAQQLLNNHQADASGRLSELRLMNSSAQRLWHGHSRGPKSAVPRNLTSLWHGFESQWQQTPEQIALRCQNRSYCYQSLWDGAQKIAAYLHGLNVVEDESVALLLPRGAAQVMAQLAVWQLGAVVVPMDPRWPSGVIAQGLAQCQARLLLRWESSVDLAALELTTPELTDITLCDLQEILKANDAPRDDGRIDVIPPSVLLSHPQQAAYRLLTSGSTGAPKLVQLSHGGVLNRIAWQWQTYPWREDDVVAQRAGVAFVDAASELWSAVLAGIPLCVVDDDLALDPFDWVEWMNEQGVSCLLLVPSLLRTLLDAYPDWAEYQPCLRRVFLSGEAMNAELLQRGREALPAVEWVNIYGASEAADVTALSLNTWLDSQPANAAADSARQSKSDNLPKSDNPLSRLRVPIGTPLSHMRLYVLDDELQACPVGVTGQLYAAGNSLAQMYWQQARATAVQFLPDPYADENTQSGARMLALGDLGRRLADGQVEFLGRGDGQLNVHGIRLEPEAIEAVLEAAPGVVNAAVVKVLNAQGEPRLVAYVQASEDARINAQQLNQYRRQHLADYLPLAALQLCDELPLNASGKVDRSALAQRGMPALSATRYQTETLWERQLLPIWQEVLGLEQVALEANFFELGGHSLSGVRVVTLMKERLGIGLSVPLLFQLSSLAAVAAHCHRLEQVSAVAKDDDSSWEVSEF